MENSPYPRMSVEIFLRFLGYEAAKELIHESDEIYLKFGADTVFTAWTKKKKEIREIRRKAINANLKSIECPIRHLGTEEGYKIYSRLQEHLFRSRRGNPF